MMGGGDYSETSMMNSNINLNNNFSSTSDNVGGLNLSATSDNNDIFISQMGGNVEKTIASPDDINNLINMLTSEKANNDFDTVTTITNTTVLENQLRELLEQAGGAKKKKSKKTSKKISKKTSKKTSKKSKKTSKKQTGGKKKAPKKSKKTSKKSKKTSKKSKKAPKKQVGRAKKKSKKTSKKSSKKKASKKKASKKSSK
jgi:hypothetical protein